MAPHSLDYMVIIWGRQPRFLIRDRDRFYGGSFNSGAARLGIEAILTPIWAPMANAVAEGVIGTLRRECLDHMIIINERLWGAKMSSDWYSGTQENSLWGAKMSSVSGKVDAVS